ncbi:MAG: oxygenase MpaB family protein [Microthrixaceae bacterium]
MDRPAAGAMYDRSTWSWRLNSRWFVLIGGARAAIMQTAHPEVAAGVATYSSYRTDPLGRLERTMDAMLTIGFGTPQRREQVLADLRRVHSGVKGRTPEGTPYSALDPQLMYWVLATLVDTTLEVERRYVGRLQRADRERFFHESRAIAEAFGIPERFVPEDLASFRRYMAAQVRSIEPSDQSVDIARSLLQPGVPVPIGLAFVPLEWVTTDLLPRTMQHRLGMADLNAVQLGAVRSAQAVARMTIPRLPAPLTMSPFTSRALRGTA